MTLLQAIILGIIQGATEFLPISSSGHLVLVPSLLGWEIPADQAFAFNILLQAATLVAVFSFFFKDLNSEEGGGQKCFYLSLDESTLKFSCT